MWMLMTGSCGMWAAYGTYVLAATDLMCKRKEVVIWNPKREVLVLVILTWTFQILILCACAAAPCKHEHSCAAQDHDMHAMLPSYPHAAFCKQQN